MCEKVFQNPSVANFMDYTALRQNDRGVGLASCAHSSLIIVIEEFTELNELFKIVCGSSKLSYKSCYKDSRVGMQNYSTILLATNNDPKCNEEAIVERLHVFPRTIQYQTLNPTKKISRSSVINGQKLQEINNILAVQLVCEGLPRILGGSEYGNFILVWVLKRFFLNDIIDPVTIRCSRTLNNNNDKYRMMIDVNEFILRRLDLNTGSMDFQAFREFVTKTVEENRNIFHSKPEPTSTFSSVVQALGNFVDNNKKIIRVTPKQIY